MCLTTTMMKPFVAKKDFVVYKALKRLGYDEYVTPFCGCSVNLNSEFKPDTEFPESVEMDIGKQFANIEGGAIHAYIEYVECNEKEKMFKSIVKKGARFYVSINGRDIAAEGLYITDEEITTDNPCTDEFAETYEYIMSELREAAEQHNGVRVGDIMLSDKTYVHVEDYKDNVSNPAIGVIGYFIDEKPVAVGLKTENLQWYTYYDYGNKPINVVATEKEAYADYKGREYTDKLYDAYKDKLEDFPALKYCVEYDTEGTKKGDWYFPSSGEVANIVRNIVLNNDSLSKIDGAELIDTDNWLWCSAESLVRHGWKCSIFNSYFDSLSFKRYWYYVRPVLCHSVK